MSKRILVVDDEDLCEEISEILAGEGYFVERAFDGQEGMRLIRENLYDLVLLDIKMPRISGLEILRNIKTNPACGENTKSPRAVTKVIMLSSHPALNKFFGENVDVCQDCPVDTLKLADEIMSKAFDVELLLHKIEKLLS